MPVSRYNRGDSMTLSLRAAFLHMKLLLNYSRFSQKNSVGSVSIISFGFDAVVMDWGI